MNVLLSVDTVRAPLTGPGRYAYELARHLPAQAGIEAMYYHDALEGLLSAQALERRAEGAVPSPLRRHSARAWRLAHRLAAGLGRRFSLSLPKRRRRRWPNSQRLLAHGPAFTLPLFGRRRVVTIADLSVLKFPQFHPTLRIKVVGHDIERALAEADHLLTFSAFTRQELIEELGCAPERVTAGPLAAAADLRPRPPAEVAPVLARYGLGCRGYCLSVGTIEPRKRIEVLLDAFETLPAPLQTRYPLVLIGDAGWLSRPTHTRIAALERAGRARYLGYVPQDTLPLLYNGAAACLYTSIYEGFGLPAVEAMASGAALIATRAASLPEVCADGAVLVAVDDAEAIGAALQGLLEDEDTARALAAAGVAAAGRFGWPRTAAETVAVYRRVAQS